MRQIQTATTYLSQSHIVDQVTAAVPEIPSEMMASEHWLLDAEQKRPEAAVHPVSPHKQASVFDDAPLVCVQSGAARHRQELELPSRMKLHLALVNIVL
jgi:hypothetical protein